MTTYAAYKCPATTPMGVGCSRPVNIGAWFCAGHQDLEPSLIDRRDAGTDAAVGAILQSTGGLYAMRVDSTGAIRGEAGTRDEIRSPHLLLNTLWNVPAAVDHLRHFQDQDVGLLPRCTAQGTEHVFLHLLAGPSVLMVYARCTTEDRVRWFSDFGGLVRRHAADLDWTDQDSPDADA